MRPFLLSLIAASALFTTSVQAQEDPGAYMNSLSASQSKMNQTYMAYVSAAAHGRRAKKLEKMRAQVLTEIDESRTRVIDLPYYKSDNSLRQSFLDYLKVLKAVFTEDYGKLVNVEEIAEQSVDEMQAYLLLKEKTGERLHQAWEMLDGSQHSFAARYNVRMSEEKSELGEKMEKAGQVSVYNDKLFILFFKCNWQDEKVLEAMKLKKVNELEQGRAALLRYANEGLAVLDTMKAFDGDPSLVNACRSSLTAYKTMAEKQYTKAADFFLAQENFDKQKKTMDAKGNSRTKEDVDAYNAAVKTINQQTDQYNQVNAEANNLRSKTVDGWNRATEQFFDQHTPHYK